MTISQPQFIVIDGITGSGKSTMIHAVKDWAGKHGFSIFDLAEWCKHQRNLPTYADVAEYDILFTFEPTKCWVGSAIRYEMSRTDSPYSGLALAQAFSLDRLTLYKRLILPARKAGKVIIQDRSVSTSIAYQPIMPDGPTLDKLLALPGNKLAMEHAPDRLILTHVPVDEVIRRIKERRDDSKGVFEDPELLKRIDERFTAQWYSQLFHDHGTHVHHFSTHNEIAATISNITHFIERLLTTPSL